jgi:hypothetical protein
MLLYTPYWLKEYCSVFTCWTIMVVSLLIAILCSVVWFCCRNCGIWYRFGGCNESTAHSTTEPSRAWLLEVVVDRICIVLCKRVVPFIYCIMVEDKRRMLLENCRLDKVGAKFLFAEHRFLTSWNWKVANGQSSFIDSIMLIVLVFPTMAAHWPCFHACTCRNACTLGMLPCVHL